MHVCAWKLFGKLPKRNRLAACAPQKRHAARKSFVARGLDDLCEAARIQAGSADEGTIDVRLAH